MTPIPMDGDIYIDNERFLVPCNVPWSDAIAGKADFSVDGDSQMLYKGKIIYHNGVAVLSTDNTVELCKYTTLQTLTGTKWAIDDNVNLSGDETYNVNFSSHGSNYSQIYLNGSRGRIKYYDTKVYDADMTGWVDQSYRIIEIADGTDATNSDLISWLEANATQVTITDLTETEWVLNSTIDLSASFNYYINFLSNGAQYTALEAYDIGRESDAGLYYNMTRVYKPDIWINEACRTIEIKDGVDVTNANFISWLEANAVQQVEPEPSSNKITFGNLPIASISFGNQKVIKMSLGNIDIYSDEEPTVAYSVTTTASGNWASENVGYVLLYDGQDEETGTPLLEQDPASKAAFPQTLSVKSGYLYFRIGGNFVSGYDMTSNEYTIPSHGSSASQFSGVIPITGNGTINIQVGDFDD